jgi:putative membrane protein
MESHNTVHARLALAVLLAGASVLSACAEGKQDGMHQQRAVTPSVGQPSGKMNLSDANIVSLLAIANQADIEGGQLAEIKASSSDVRSYGTRMISDHGSMLSQGNQLSKQLMINPVEPALGQQMLSEHQKSMEALKKKSGEEFDRAYIEHEIEMHQKVIRLVDQATQAADHPQLRTLLEQSRPALNDHLEQAQNVRQSLVANR